MIYHVKIVLKYKHLSKMENCIPLWIVHKNISKLRAALELVVGHKPKVSDDELLHLTKKYAKTLKYHLSKMEWSKYPSEMMNSQMSSKYRSERSYNGMPLDILKSGIQKYCRRSNFDKAVWCAIELDLFSYSCDDSRRATGIITNFIHRLMIIYLEDVSLGALHEWSRLSSLFDDLQRCRKERKTLKISDSVFRKNRKTEMNAVVEIVHILASSPHTRILSHYMTCFGRVRSLPVKEVARIVTPEFATLYDSLDEPVHECSLEFKLNECEKEVEQEVTSFIACLEKRLPSCVYWAYEILRKLAKCSKRFGKTATEYLLFSILEHFVDAEYFKLAIEWFNELSTVKEKDLCWMILICHLLHENEVNLDAPESKLDVVPSSLYARNLDGQVIEIDDFVVDMHTQQGRREKKGRIAFAQEGSYVDNESPVTVAVYKTIYEAVKVAQEKGIEHVTAVDELSYKESERFEVRCRAQVTCAATRPCVYFAVDKISQQKIVVKGPYPSKKEACKTLVNYQAKTLFEGIDGVPVMQEELYPDLFENCPFGFRKDCNRNEKYPFLVFQDMTEEDELPTKLKNTNMWKDTTVVDWDLVESCIPIPKALAKTDPIAYRLYILNVLYRYVVGIGDLADRNFLYLPKTHMVYSIDEEAFGKEVDLYSNLRKNKATEAKDWIAKEWKTIQDTLAKWKEKVSSSEGMTFLKKLYGLKYKEMIERLETIQNKKKCMQLFEEH